MEPNPEWFLSLGMGFRGPFTTEEVQDQLARAEVGRENLVWADGMHDWQPLAKVKLFEPFALRAVPFVHEPPWMEDGERDFSAILRSISEERRVHFAEIKSSLSARPRFRAWNRLYLFIWRFLWRK